jgi:hypothetical protein
MSTSTNRITALIMNRKCDQSVRMVRYAIEEYDEIGSVPVSTTPAPQTPIGIEWRVL